MAKRSTVSTVTNGLYYSFDAGNGTCKAVSSERSDLIAFAPVIAPMTAKRAISEDEARPAYSLKVDDQILVFGVNDVFAHGKRTSVRRLNSAERYLSPDYFRLLDVLYLQAFASRRGNSDYIAPTGVISVPVSQFNNDDVLGQIRETLTGRHVLEDYEGCTLRLSVEGKKLLIIPESTGAMTHYAFAPDTLRRRADVAGSSLVIDIGYETTDISLFEGMAYQRDQAFTLPRAGMGIVARAVQEQLRHDLREADASRIDYGMRLIAGTKPGAPKSVEVAPGIRADVGPIYDAEIEELANKIADEIRTIFTGAVNRAILAGGGALHLARALADRLPFELTISPDPDMANVQGAYTLLQLKFAAGR